MTMLCPVCEDNNIFFVSNYINKNRSFLSAKYLKKCNNCGIVFADPMPRDSELNSYYSEGLYYDTVKNPNSTEILNFSLKLAQSRVKIISDIIELNKIKKILEIGAGNAQFGRIVKQLYPEIVYDAVEPDNNCRKQWGTWISNGYSSIKQSSQLNYNLIVLNQVLEHVNKPIQFLTEISEYLQPRGYLYVDVPHKDYLFKPSVEPHLLFWGKQSLDIVLKKCGYKTLFYDSAGMKIQQAKQYFHNQTFLRKITNHWSWIRKFNEFLKNFGFNKRVDTFRQFQADKYGGDRQWLRYIAQKSS